MEIIDKKTQGKKNRAKGSLFERKVRKDLERQGWIVCKWMNNVTDNQLHAAKQAWNPFKKILTIGTGFPDFIAFRLHELSIYEIRGIEVKYNGILSKIEKEKCEW